MPVRGAIMNRNGVKVCSARFSASRIAEAITTNTAISEEASGCTVEYTRHSEFGGLLLEFQENSRSDPPPSFSSIVMCEDM